MRFPTLAILALAVSLPLTACSTGDWEYLTSFGSSHADADDEEIAEAPQPPSSQATSAAPRQVASAQAPAAPAAAQAAAPAMDPWCSQVMSADVDTAQRNGLDQVTQQRMAVRSYRQCLAIFGPSLQ